MEQIAYAPFDEGMHEGSDAMGADFQEVSAVRPCVLAIPIMIIHSNLARASRLGEPRLQLVACQPMNSHFKSVTIDAGCEMTLAVKSEHAAGDRGGDWKFMLWA